MAEDHITFVSENAEPNDMTLQEVQETKHQDPTLEALIGFLHKNR